MVNRITIPQDAVRTEVMNIGGVQVTMSFPESDQRCGAVLNSLSKQATPGAVTCECQTIFYSAAFLMNELVTNPDLFPFFQPLEASRLLSD